MKTKNVNHSKINKRKTVAGSMRKRLNCFNRKPLKTLYKKLKHLKKQNQNEDPPQEKKAFRI